MKNNYYYYLIEGKYKESLLGFVNYFLTVFKLRIKKKTYNNL